MIKAVLHRLAVLGAIWASLAPPGAEAVVVGAMAVPAAAWLSLRLLPARNPMALWRLLRHLPRFVSGSVIGGVDVARRAFAPGLPLHPGWVERPVALSAGGRVILGGELSLMPGTLAAGSDGTRLLVHLLDTEAGFDAGIERDAGEIAAILGETPDDRRGRS